MTLTHASSTQAEQAAAADHRAIESGTTDAPETKQKRGTLLGGGAPTDTGRTYRTVAIGNISKSTHSLSEEPFRMGARAHSS